VYGTVAGNVTLFAEGKITIGNDSRNKGKQADLTYSNLNDAKLHNDMEIEKANSSKDALGLITPRKIDIRPYVNKATGDPSIPKVEKFAICAAMMNMGSPPPKYGAGAVYYENERNRFSIALRQEGDPTWDTGEKLLSNYIPYNVNKYGSASNPASNEFQNLVFFGTGIKYFHSATYKGFYKAFKTRYDETFLSSTPSFFPTMSGGYNVAWWREADLETGEDHDYKRLPCW